MTLPSESIVKDQAIALSVIVCAIALFPEQPKLGK